jgi:hypothetical protein
MYHTNLQNPNIQSAQICANLWPNCTRQNPTHPDTFSFFSPNKPLQLLTFSKKEVNPTKFHETRQNPTFIRRGGQNKFPGNRPLTTGHCLLVLCTQTRYNVAA